MLPFEERGKERLTRAATAQYNFSDVDGLDLEIQLGEVGGLHCDGRDDYRRWTVLLALDNTLTSDFQGGTLWTKE